MKVLTEKQLKILDLFKKDVFEEYTIREVSKLLKASYTWTFNVIKNLNRMNILNINKKGKANICSINFNNSLTITYLSLLDEVYSSTKKLPWKNINKLLNSIDTPYFTFIIAGSYAEQKQTEKSDLDIVIIVDNNTSTKHIESTLSEGELMIPTVHLYTFTKSQFIEMLISKESNYGKLIFKKHLIMCGAYNYYLIIKEAIKNGYTGN